MADFLHIAVQLIASSFAIPAIVIISKWRFPKRTVVIAASVAVTLLLISNIAVLSFLNANELPLASFIYRAWNTAAVIIFILVVIKQPFRETLFAFLTATTFVLVTDTFALSLRIWLGSALELFWNLLLYSIMVYSAVKIRKPFLAITDYLKKRIYPLCLMPLFLIVCFFMQISVPVPLEHAHNNIPVALMLCLIAISIYGIIFFSFKSLLNQTRLEENMKLMKLHASSLKYQNNITEQTRKSAAVFRHDMRHYTSMILLNLDNGKTDEIRNILSEIDINICKNENINTVQEITGYTLIDTVLSYHMRIGSEARINISVNMERMSDVSVNITELAVALFNALENAINACIKITEHEPRVIKIIGNRRGVQYFIEIANTYTGEVEFNSVTELPVRKGEETQGFGSQSIAYFVQKHNAILQYDVKNGWFKLRLLI